MRIVKEIIAGRKATARKEGEGTETGRKGDNNSTCWTCGKSRHIAASCPNGAKRQPVCRMVRRKVKSENKQLTMRKNCKRGACWKRA